VVVEGTARVRYTFFNALDDTRTEPTTVISSLVDDNYVNPWTRRRKFFRSAPEFDCRRGRNKTFYEFSSTLPYTLFE